MVARSRARCSPRLLARRPNVLTELGGPGDATNAPFRGRVSMPGASGRLARNALPVESPPTSSRCPATLPTQNFRRPMIAIREIQGRENLVGRVPRLASQRTRRLAAADPGGQVGDSEVRLPHAAQGVVLPRCRIGQVRNAAVMEVYVVGVSTALSMTFVVALASTRASPSPGSRVSAGGLDERGPSFRTCRLNHTESPYVSSRRDPCNLSAHAPRTHSPSCYRTPLTALAEGPGATRPDRRRARVGRLRPGGCPMASRRGSWRQARKIRADGRLRRAIRASVEHRPLAATTVGWAVLRRDRRLLQAW
jgi:hypothetical protein